jgi:hypothetical protein
LVKVDGVYYQADANKANNKYFTDGKIFVSAGTLDSNQIEQILRRNQGLLKIVEINQPPVNYYDLLNSEFDRLKSTNSKLAKYTNFELFLKAGGNIGGIVPITKEAIAQLGVTSDLK